ncbi:hypothetical protein ABNG03_10125 [Halorubrum sp. RMP-47]|uniref:SMODS-associating 2TM beta-strand rich effector domain-containing protein n=1 Tax=Halorubrum miltondacostae TaxID=3076378 RepID=A0ABD5LWC0_9EURY
MADVNRRLSLTLLLGVFGTIVASILDVTLFGSTLFVDSTLDFFSNKKDSLSVIVSTLLLTTYLMQYLIQSRQADLSERQEKLMRSGFTPILGVTEREWGSERDDENNIQHQKANKVYVNLVNNGNSAARNLRLWTGVKYDLDCCSNTYYSSHTVPLTRTEEGTWWPTDQGGAISESDNGSVEFKASPKLKEMNSNTLRSDDVVGTNHIGDVLKDIGSDNEQVSIILAIKYQTATGDEQEITIGGYREKINQFRSKDWKLEGAHELGPEDYEELKKDVF